MTASPLIDDHRTMEDYEYFLREFCIPPSLSTNSYRIPPPTLPPIRHEDVAHVSRWSRGGFVCIDSREFVAKMTAMQKMKLEKALMTNNFNDALFVTNTFSNRVLFKDYQLSLGAQRMMNMPNAGGSSDISEALSYELFARLFPHIRLNRTEMEIAYKNNHGKRTDYSMYVNANDCNESIIGVSVSRAMKYRGEFTMDDADRLLRKKLYGVIVSNDNVIPCHDNYWSKQILHIWCEARYVADRLRRAYHRLLRQDPSFVSTTVIVATVAENSGFIFSNRDGIMNNKEVKKQLTAEEVMALIEKEKSFPFFPSPSSIAIQEVDLLYRGWHCNRDDQNRGDHHNRGIRFSLSPRSSPSSLSPKLPPKPSEYSMRSFSIDWHHSDEMIRGEYWWCLLKKMMEKNE